MALIKKNQIHDSGTILLEQSPQAIVKKVTDQLSSEAFKNLAGQEDNITKVKSEAQKIIGQAAAEAAEIKDRAYQEGLDKGKSEGKSESAAKMAEALQTLNQAVIERKKIIKDAENEIMRLSIKIAEQIIKSEVSLHRDVCLNIVTEAIARVSDREQIIVKASREDAEYLKRFKDRLAAMLDGVRSFSILEDPSIEPGGCVVETNLGYIDARIATKIKAIEDALAKVAEDKSSAETKN